MNSFTSYLDERLNFKIKYDADLNSKLIIEEPGERKFKLTFWTENHRVLCLIDSYSLTNSIHSSKSSLNSLLKDNELKLFYHIKSDHILVGYWPLRIGYHNVELKSINNSRQSIKILVLRKTWNSTSPTLLVDLTNEIEDVHKVMPAVKKIGEEMNRKLDNGLLTDNLIYDTQPSNFHKQNFKKINSKSSNKITLDDNLIGDSFLQQLKSNDDLNEKKYKDSKSVKGLVSYRTMDRLDQLDDQLKLNTNKTDNQTTPAFNALISTNLSFTNLNAIANTENCLTSCSSSISIQSCIQSNKSIRSLNSKSNSTDPEIDFVHFRDRLLSTDQKNEFKPVDCMINDPVNADQGNCITSKCSSTSSTETLDSFDILNASTLLTRYNNENANSDSLLGSINHDQVYVYDLDDEDDKLNKEANYELIVEAVENENERKKVLSQKQLGKCIFFCGY